MATIKDIAKVAGVAQGTVSNVLNNRGNVSSDKIRRVLSACDQLGYVPNDQAKRLRQSHSRLIGVILPNLRDKRTIDFYISFKTCVENHGYSVRQYLSSELDGQQSEEAIQQEVLRDGVGAMAVFAGSQPMMSVPFNGETSVIYVEHRPSFAADFIGFNYREAGARVAEAVRENGCARIVLLTGSLWASSTAEFCAGFRENMRNTAAEITHIQTDKQSEQQSILQSRELTCADAVVCSRMELAQVARNLLRSFGGSTLPRIYTLSPLFTLPESDFSKYELNYRLLGDATAKKLIRWASSFCPTTVSVPLRRRPRLTLHSRPSTSSRWTAPRLTPCNISPSSTPTRRASRFILPSTPMTRFSISSTAACAATRIATCCASTSPCSLSSPAGCSRP